MLREKKFNALKHFGLNRLFDYCIDDKNNIFDIDYFVLNKEVYLNSFVVNEGLNIIKDKSLETYFMILKDITIIHIQSEFIHDFEFLYRKSNEYVFDIYKTSSHDIKTEEEVIMYHIFCVSKKIQELDIDYMSFLKTNDCDKKYICLSVFYGPCIIMNKRFDILLENDKLNSKYTYVKTIGKGSVDYSIRSYIKHMIHITNHYQSSLPPHYLKIN